MTHKSESSPPGFEIEKPLLPPGPQDIFRSSECTQCTQSILPSDFRKTDPHYGGVLLSENELKHQRPRICYSLRYSGFCGQPGCRFIHVPPPATTNPTSLIMAMMTGVLCAHDKYGDTLLQLHQDFCDLSVEIYVNRVRLEREHHLRSAQVPLPPDPSPLSSTSQPVKKKKSKKKAISLSKHPLD